MSLTKLQGTQPNTCSKFNRPSRNPQRCKSYESPLTKHNTININQISTIAILRQDNPHSFVMMQVSQGLPMLNLQQIMMKKAKDEGLVMHDEQLVGFKEVNGNYVTDYCLFMGQSSVSSNLQFYCIFVEDCQGSLAQYQVCNCLSVGGFSKVYLLRNLINGAFYAGKFIRRKDDGDKNLQNEAYINEIIGGINGVVTMYQLVTTNHFNVMVMEYCSGGELFNLIKKNRLMPQRSAQFYVVSLMLVIKSLHLKGIVYRDLKPENVLIDHHGRPKLADFGLAKLIKTRSKSNCGSIEYMAPEIINQQPHSFEVDYYTIGVLLFEMLIGCPPFYNPQYTPMQTKYHILYDAVEFPPDLPLSSQVKDLILSLMKRDYRRRLGYKGGFQQIMEHSWFKNVNFAEFEAGQVQAPFGIDFSRYNFESLPEEETREFTKLINYDLKMQKKKYMKKKRQRVCKSPPRISKYNTKNKIQLLAINDKSKSKSKSKLKVQNSNQNNIISANSRINKKQYKANSISRLKHINQPKIQSISKIVNSFQNQQCSLLKKSNCQLKENNKLKFKGKLYKRKLQWKSAKNNLRITLC